ncbi:MAG: hypothetical protein ACRENE_01970 [Polyangiaceae bacterium]
MGPRRFALLGTCAAWMGLAGQAGATPTARLVYSRAVGAESCPDEASLRKAVAARIGYDPFFAWAPKTIVASMAPDPSGGFVARVGLVDDRGTEHGTRDLRTPGPCDDLLDTSALAIAIAIDPQSLAPRPASDPPAPAPATKPTPAPLEIVARPAAAEARVPAAPSPSRWAVEASAGAAATAGIAPAPAAGFGLGVAVASPRLSLGLEGRIDAPVSIPATGRGSVSSWSALGALVPCARAGPLLACALAQVGVLQASSQGVEIEHGSTLLWLAAGLRLGVEVPIEKATRLRIHSDFLADLDPPVLRLSGWPAWTAPPLAATLGGDVVAHF